MTTKLWDKNTSTDALMEAFTIGKDRELDLLIAPYDVLASKAHAKMLAKAGLISQGECKDLLQGLDDIQSLLDKKAFRIEDGVEDIHSQIEFYLTEKYGDTGKKIHTARSRNDQVLTAIKLYLKHELKQVEEQALQLKSVFTSLSELHTATLMPGYTHFQIAMPSSFGLWFGAYAESIDDDLELLKAAYAVCDKNPLGSAAGYGSSFNIDRQFTTDELHFSGMNVNSIYAQMTRGKTEKIVAMALSSLAHTISRFSYDVCLFMCQNFGFVSFPDRFTTGSSIMPHKKNPDVFELLRAKCNVIQGLPNQFILLTNNLPSGYHRDMQLTKELLFPSIAQLKNCLEVLTHVLPNIVINAACIEHEKYDYLFSVEEVNRLVQSGLSFRDAYKMVAMQIENGTYVPKKEVRHTHAGSIGN
ncbi:MAG: argininosuccinate lyase [Bacteroidia bacterium]